MNYILFVICFLLPVFGFLKSLQNKGLTHSVLSHFWYFTLFWIVAFPVRAAFIKFDLVDLQVPITWPGQYLSLSLLVSLLFWISIYGGYLSSHRKMESPSGTFVVSSKDSYRGKIVLLGALVLGGLFIGKTLFDAGLSNPFIGMEQNEARIGWGGWFLFSELFLFAWVAYLGIVLSSKRKAILSSQEWGIFAVILLIALFLTIALNTRRILAGLVFSIVLVFLVRNPNKKTLALGVVLGSILLAPVLQVVRYLKFLEIFGDAAEVLEDFGQIVQSKYFLTILSSSFEGVDHLAAFLYKCKVTGFLTGVDAGMAWLYNIGLALVPRFLWAGKPLSYGSISEQKYLYPFMFEDSLTPTTIPVSFAVDFLYGFGLIPALVLAFLLGRFLHVMGDALWNSNCSPLERGLALFLFINMFNVLRSGTGIIQSVIIFLAVSGFIFGFRESFVVCRSIFKKVFSFPIIHRIKMKYQLNPSLKKNKI